MKDITKKINGYFLLIFLELLLLVTVYFSTRSSMDLRSFFLINISIILIIICFYLKLPMSIGTSLIFVFLYGSYLIYEAMANTIYESSMYLYIWLIIIPALCLTSSSLGSSILALKDEANSFKNSDYIDPITKFDNKYNFYKHLEGEMALSRRHNLSLTLLIIEIQYFDQLSAIYPNEIVEKVIKNLSESINKITRLEDKKYTLDKGSFAVILPQTTEAGGEVLKNRLKSSLEDINVEVRELNRGLNFNFKMSVKEYSKTINESSLDFKAETERNLEYDV